MPDTTTPILGLTKPAVGEAAGIDAWGDKLNANFDAIDNLGKYRHILSQTASNATAVVFSIPAWPISIELFADQVYGSSPNVNTYAQISFDGGATWYNAYNSINMYAYSAGPYGSWQGTSAAILDNADLDLTTPGSFRSDFTLGNANSRTVYHSRNGGVRGDLSSGIVGVFWGYASVTGRPNAIRISKGSGNINGKFSIWGRS